MADYIKKTDSQTAALIVKASAATIIRDETKPAGFVLAGTAVIFPPIRLKPFE